MFSIGLCLSVYLGIDKIFINPIGRLITQRPIFYIALITMVLGSQFFIAGFLGELILKSKRDTKRYLVNEEVNF